MPMDNVTLENTQQSISSRDAKSVASVMVNGKWVNLSDTLEQANVKSDVGTVSKQVAEQQTVITSAVAQADSAVAYANDAIEKSRVNSQAIEDINSAVSDAVSDAAVARSDGLRAWDAAQSNVDLIDSNYASASAAISSARTEAIAAADEAKASASAAQADIVAVRSDVAAVQADVTANKSDVAVAKNDIVKAKSDATAGINAVKSDVAVAKSDITDTKTSLASQAKSLSSYAAQASAAGQDITVLKSQAGQFEQDMADTKGDVSQLKVSASSASAALSDAAGNISSLQASAKSYSAALSDTNSNVATVTATASELETKYADAAGDINKLQVDASGMKQTLTDAQGNISTLQATATGFKNTLTDAQGNISTLQSDVSGLKKTTSDQAGNIATLQADAKTLTSQMSSAQGDISTLQQTASGFSSKVSGMETSLANANDKLNSITSNGGGRNLAIGTDQEYTMGYGIPNTTWEDGYAYLKLPANTTDREVLPQYPHTFYHTLTKGTTYTQTIWFETDAKLGNSSGVQITWFTTSAGHDGQPATLINLGENKYKLYSTYMWPGKSDNSVRLFDIFYLDSAFDLSTGTYLKFGRLKLEDGIISTDWSPAPEDTDAKITTNSAAIDQNKKAIALKADQTVVDKANGDVALLKAQLKVQADQISGKVSSSDLDAKGYATQTYTQTLVTQKANEWNLNLTSLKTDVNVIKTTGGGVNLLQGTRDFSGTGIQGSKVAVTNGQDKFQAAYGTQNSSQTYFDLVCFSKIPLEKDTDYTASFWVKTSEDTEIRSFLFDSGSNGNYADGATVNHSTTDYTRIVVHFHNGNNTATPNFIPVRIQKPGVTVWLYGCMLEEGTVAHTWSPTPSDMATVTSVTNLSTTVDGIQAQVYNKDGSSRITQLSNLIATKVSSGDYNSQITQLKNDINLRVAKGNVVSQINQEAGGNTLIQVSGGKGKLALNASSVIFSGSAFIPDAYISTLNADKLRFYDSSGNVATMSANLVQHDDDKVARTINLQYNGGYEVHASNTLGSILTMHDDTIRLAVKSSGSSGDQYSGVYAMTHYTQLSNYRSDGSAPGVFIYDDQFNILGDANGAGTSKGDMHISSPQLYLNGSSKLQAGGDHALLTIASDYTTIHADKNVWMETGNTQLHLDNSNNLEIFNKNNTNTSNYDVHLTVRGWATFTGWINCLGLTQTSRLSTKTNIERLDTARALELINSADVATYQYKQDVANGGTKRHASVIIDDVNDVAQYQTPDEFISEDRSGRNDGDIVGYLMGAVQELTKKIKTLESKVG